MAKTLERAPEELLSAEELGAIRAEADPKAVMYPNE